jgi:hypothetical protein
MFPIHRHHVGLFALLCLFEPGCGKSDHPPIYQTGRQHEPSDAGYQIPMDAYDASVPPPEDTTNFCGNQVIPLVTSRPNLYFVLDRSGSMSDPMPDPSNGSSIEKFIGARRAIHDVLFAMGHRIAYGAAVFPRIGNISTCDPGGEIDKVAPGDSVTYARNGIDGPHLVKLFGAPHVPGELSTYVPEGATPTSATLEYLFERLIALSGDTAVVLATDGAPNCNKEVTCDIAHCIPNIEGSVIINGPACDNTINCCDLFPGNCIDADASVAPITALLGHGIKTYVIGLPGSEAYQEVLNRFAIAGGTARVQTAATDPIYYPVTDTQMLTQALRNITAEFSISCTVVLDQAPPDWTQVNVYFDNGLVKMNPADGWKQIDSTTLEITGPACDLLRSGDVFQIQVVAGCPTETLI